MLTMSPATMPWFVAPIVTAASPVRTPARAWMPCQPRHRRLDQLERGAHRALGVVFVRGGRAPHGHDRIADELLDRAAVALDDLACDIEIARQRLADVFRVTFLGKGREADEVGEEDADDAALGGVWVAAVGVAAGLGQSDGPPPQVLPSQPARTRIPGRTWRRAGTASSNWDKQRPAGCRTRRKTWMWPRWACRS